MYVLYKYIQCNVQVCKEKGGRRRNICRDTEEGLYVHTTVRNYFVSVQSTSVRERRRVKKKI